MCKRVLFTIIIVTIIVFYTSFCYADSFTKMDAAGNRILYMIRRVGYWVVTIKAIQEVIQSALNGGTKNIGGILTKYMIMYGSLFAIPYMLKLVEGIF